MVPASTGNLQSSKIPWARNVIHIDGLLDDSRKQIQERIIQAMSNRQNKAKMSTDKLLISINLTVKQVFIAYEVCLGSSWNHVIILDRVIKTEAILINFVYYWLKCQFIIELHCLSETSFYNYLSLVVCKWGSNPQLSTLWDDALQLSYHRGINQLFQCIKEIIPKIPMLDKVVQTNLPNTDDVCSLDNNHFHIWRFLIKISCLSFRNDSFKAASTFVC